MEIVEHACTCSSKQQLQESQSTMIASQDPLEVPVSTLLPTTVTTTPLLADSSIPTPPIVSTTVATPTIQFEKTFHRRLLPKDCIAFSSPEGKQLFIEALSPSANFMQIYFPLAEQFTTQAEPAYCGLATLAMCLNALEVDPRRLWKGAWRWYSEELLDCCTSLNIVKEKGISFEEFICLAKCNDMITEHTRATSELTLDQLREIIKRVCSTSSEIVVANYSRKVLGQTGDGHFSPIGGYHEGRDMVLLLDVARFKYPPHWVRLSLLLESIQRIDASSGLPRGLIVLKRNSEAVVRREWKQRTHCCEFSSVPKN